MNYQKDPHIEITVSNESYRSKPTSQEIALAVENLKHGWVRKTTYATLTDLVNFIESGKILFPTRCYPGESIINPMNLIFCDFDNTGEKSMPRETVISKLKNIGLYPNVVYDTYNSTKEQNRFRLVYVLSKTIHSKEEAEQIEKKFKYILKPFGMDENARITGLFFSGFNVARLSNKTLDTGLLNAIYNKLKKRAQKKVEVKPEMLMLPTADGFAYALSLVDNDFYLKSKGKVKVVLRLLKNDTKPVEMEFDDDIANVNLLVLKVLYTLHCRKETDCIDSDKHLYSVDVSLLVRKTGINFYERKMQRLQAMLTDYNRLVACIGENQLLTVLRNKIEDGKIIYSGRYFDWLKSLLFDSPDSTVPKQQTHNFMLKYEALVGGNMYAELIAEQLLRSVLMCGVIQKYRGISIETLMSRIPQLKNKYNDIKSSNEKNTFLKRVLKSLEIILAEKSSFNERYKDYNIIYPPTSSKHLNRQITITATEASKLNDFLEDFANYPANFEVAPYDDCD